MNYMNRKNDVIINEENTFYTVAMRGMVAFPKMVMHFDIARSKSVKAVEYAAKNGGKIFLVAKKIAEEKGLAEDGYRIVNNCKYVGGQEVFHIHFHLVGGEKLGHFV